MTSALHVETVGAGPPLVLLHGWGLHAGLWTPILPRLARQFRVHAVDLPGHGHSEAQVPLDLDVIAAALDDALAQEGAPLAVLGWSLGALFAMQWAHRAPQRVGSLVLVGATPRFTTSPDWPHAMEPGTLARFGDELAVAYRLTLKRFLALQVHGSEHGRRALAALREHLFARGEPSAEGLAAGLEVLRSTDLRAMAPTLGQPALVIAGGRDALTPPEAGAWLAGAMPHGELLTIPEAAHAPFLSHPEPFLAAVERFLERVTR